VRPRPVYPETREPFTWPTPGVRTWQATPDAVFPPCTGGVDCEVGAACPVDWRNVAGFIYGCGCQCHAEKRARLMAARHA
jgi:hypothetical protein